MPVSKAQKEKVHKAARQRIIKDASIHVRLTEDLMALLLDCADRQNVPVNVLVRRWLEDKLTGAEDLESRVARLEKQLKTLKKGA
jgi:predicted DNA binding CopG/RHH family protein